MMAQTKKWHRMAATLALLGITGTAAARAQTPAAPRIDPTWLKSDSGTHTVEFSLIAGLGGLNGGMNFNGVTSGALGLVVPVGWHVVLRFRNADPNMPHSAVVIPAATPLPAAAGHPAFDAATTSRPEQGLATGAIQNMVFDADHEGSYMIFCAVPGHGMAGMWMRLEVSATAKSASIGQSRTGP
jgi:hypothetical protein